MIRAFMQADEKALDDEARHEFEIRDARDDARIEEAGVRLSEVVREWRASFCTKRSLKLPTVYTILKPELLPQQQPR